MTITPIAFRSDSRSDSADEVLVNSVIVVRPGDVLTPCVPVGVRPASLRMKKPKCRVGGWSIWDAAPAFHRTTTTAPSSIQLQAADKEGAEWADHSRNTLRSWMADNEY